MKSYVKQPDWSIPKVGDWVRFERGRELHQFQITHESLRNPALRFFAAEGWTMYHLQKWPK